MSTSVSWHLMASPSSRHEHASSRTRTWHVVMHHDYICIHIRTHTYIYLHIYIYIMHLYNIYIYIRHLYNIYLHICIKIYTSMHHDYIYVHIHTHIHTFIQYAYIKIHNIPDEHKRVLALDDVTIVTNPRHIVMHHSHFVLILEQPSNHQRLVSEVRNITQKRDVYIPKRDL